MFKILTFLTRKEGLEVEAFADYYENRHIPFILSLAPSPPVYTRRYLKRGTELNPANGSVDFAGTVRFTGHGGILDTTIGNPVLVFQGTDDAVLLLDVAGATMEGDAVEVTEARFVTVDLTGQDLTPVDGIVTIVDAPTALTVEGEEAFPNYPAGEAFDPISATIDLGDCDLTGQPIGTDTVDGGDGVIGDATPWVLLVIVLAAVLVILVTILFVGRLRR